MNKIKIMLVLMLIITVALIVRTYQIDKVPPSLNIDESSEGYNAFSLLNTGKDRYGQDWPILFRSFGSFQAPLYTYLTIIPIYFLGNTILAVRLVSIISGILLIIITFFLINKLNQKYKINLAVIAGLTLTFTPWSVFFSRIGTEASLGVSLFALSFLILYLSLERFWLFPLGVFILGLSTHAYYSERIISPFFLIGFIVLFRKRVFLKKKLFFFGMALFLLTQVPHLLIATSGAFTRRLAQVDYLSDQFFQSNSGNLHNIFFGRQLFIIREFITQYLAFFSSKNLFFDPDPQPDRSIPNLSVFYSWMLIPWLLGIGAFLKRRSEPAIKLFLLSIFLGPIPAALTRDPFYTLRSLIFLWITTIMIALGISNFLSKIPLKITRYSLSFLLLAYSLFSLYLSYFILFKYERATFDYSHTKLLERINQMPDKNFVIDSSRHLAAGIRAAFFNRYDPIKLQKDFKSHFPYKYYSSFEIEEPFVLEKVDIRPIIWKKDICINQILVGDLLAISENQIKEHNLNFVFDVQDMAGNISLKAYSTDPSKACK